MANNEESKNMQVGEAAFDEEDHNEGQNAKVNLKEEVVVKPTFKLMAKDIDAMADELMIDSSLAKTLLVKSEGNLTRAMKYYIESY